MKSLKCWNLNKLNLCLGVCRVSGIYWLDCFVYKYVKVKRSPYKIKGVTDNTANVRVSRDGGVCIWGGVYKKIMRRGSTDGHQARPQGTVRSTQRGMRGNWNSVRILHPLHDRSISNILGLSFLGPNFFEWPQQPMNIRRRLMAHYRWWWWSVLQRALLKIIRSS